MPSHSNHFTQCTQHSTHILYRHLSFTAKESHQNHHNLIDPDRSTPPQITSSSPNHPANSFFYPRLKHLPPIAKVMLTKIKKTNQIISFPVEPTQSNQLPTDNEIEEKRISKFEACGRFDEF